MTKKVSLNFLIAYILKIILQKHEKTFKNYFKIRIVPPKTVISCYWNFNNVFNFSGNCRRPSTESRHLPGKVPCLRQWPSLIPSTPTTKSNPHNKDIPTPGECLHKCPHLDFHQIHYAQIYCLPVYMYTKNCQIKKLAFIKTSSLSFISLSPSLK